MNLIFYILIYLTVDCWNPCMLLTTDLYQQGLQSCQSICSNSSVHEMKIVNDINALLEYKNNTLGSKGLYVYQKEPNHIYKVTVENGKFSQKEVKIVPIIKKTKFTVEQEKETIEGYKVE